MVPARLSCVQPHATGHSCSIWQPWSALSQQRCDPRYPAAPRRSTTRPSRLHREGVRARPGAARHVRGGTCGKVDKNAKRACERSSDWPRRAAAFIHPDPEQPTTQSAGPMTRTSMARGRGWTSCTKRGTSVRALLRHDPHCCLDSRCCHGSSQQNCRNGCWSRQGPGWRGCCCRSRYRQSCSDG
jgi:hypothetical protein